MLGAFISDEFYLQKCLMVIFQSSWFVSIDRGQVYTTYTTRITQLTVGERAEIRVGSSERAGKI